MKQLKHTIRLMASAAALAFVVFSCKGKLPESGELNLDETPIQVVENVFSVSSENSDLQMRMEAKTMMRFENDSMMYEKFPDGFAVYGYMEDGRLETEITADNALHRSWNDGREEWQATGNVVVKNLIKREVMETDTLYWDKKEEKIFTHCYVKMWSPDGFMQGYGMESDQRARNSILYNNFNNYAIVVKDSTEVIVDSVNLIGPLKPGNLQ
ncbi:MAG: LPS export ABC transporter periplasmic protein LptC [Candidatus Cryptobacteroides sp.]